MTTRRFDCTVEKTATGFAFRIWHNIRTAPFFAIDAEGDGFANMAEAIDALNTAAEERKIVFPTDQPTARR